MSEVTIYIDNREISVPDGTLVVDAAKTAGNDIPVFCLASGECGIKLFNDDFMQHSPDAKKKKGGKRPARRRVKAAAGD